MSKRTKRPILFIAGTNCNDPSREAEFNKWYNETHIPELCKQPGFIRARRYEIVNSREGYPKYLAVYELEDEAAWNKLGEHMKKVRASKAPDFTPGPPFTVIWMAAYKPI